MAIERRREPESVGDSVKFTFYGSNARAYGTLANEMGSFEVAIDAFAFESPAHEIRD